jgi:hypothetical protein
VTACYSLAVILYWDRSEADHDIAWDWDSGCRMTTTRRASDERARAVHAVLRTAIQDRPGLRMPHRVPSSRLTRTGAAAVASAAAQPFIMSSGTPGPNLYLWVDPLIASASASCPVKLRTYGRRVKKPKAKRSSPAREVRVARPNLQTHRPPCLSCGAALLPPSRARRSTSLLLLQ